MRLDVYTHNGFFIRKLLLKVLILLGILLFLFGFIPMFRSYKSSNKKVNDSIKIIEKNTNNSSENNFKKLKQASLSYFNSKNIPTKINDSKKVTLNTLINKKLISKIYNSDNKVCDVSKSYVKLTKLNNDYLLKLYIKCGNYFDYKLIHVGKYSYCKNTLCEKDSTKINYEDKDSKTDDNNSNEVNNSINNSDNININIKLSDFGAWSGNTIVDCNTSDIVCDINDTNCLREVKITRDKKVIGVNTKTYSKEIYSIIRTGFKPTEVCPGYDYFYFNNELYRTSGNYNDVLNLNKNINSTWKYVNTVNLDNAPSFDLNSYYQFVSMSSNTLTFDVYKFNSPIYKGETSTFCFKRQKLISMYTVKKEIKTTTVNENIYQDVCYMNTRERRIIK